MSLPPKTWVEVSSSALRHNAGVLRKLLAPKAELMAVVKSNAYGHGLAETVGVLRRHVDWFGVDSVLEAQVVRRTASRARIVVLGVTPASWLSSVDRLTRLSVSNAQQAAQIAKSRRPFTVHLEIETGLTRQGIDMADLPGVVRLLDKKKNVHMEGLFMHFANIDEGGFEHPYPQKQIKEFLKARVIVEKILGRPIRFAHAACSAPGILFPQTHFNLVRAGIAMYGLWPSEETRRRAQKTHSKTHLKPALTWKTVIAQVKQVTRGTPVGYGLSKRMPHDGRIAVLPIGYWDGYDRGLASLGTVIVRGQRANIIGRICMNMCMVNVSHIRGVRADDEVILVGGRGEVTIPAEDLATKLRTINYEVVTRINPTIPRIVV